MRPILAMTCLLLVLSCKQDSGSNSTTAGATSAPAATTPQSTTPVLPKIPNELLMQMWNDGHMIDYVFHELPFSMNQNEKASIQTNLTYIDSAPVTQIPDGCVPMARQFYQISTGDIIYEADVYFDKECQLYVFYVDGKATYANQMAQSGKTFFTQMINQAMHARQGIRQ